MIRLVKPSIGQEEKKLINEVLDSGMLASGKYVQDFERKFASLCGAKHGIAVSSGTTALHAALLACGCCQGDLVITTPFSFIATANSVLYCGARPLFADINEDDFNISPERIEYLLKKNKKAKFVMIVHLFGNPCRMDDIMYLKKKYGFSLIEDCAQSHEAEYGGKKTGTFGDASAFSFYATKNMLTGEGGIVLTGSDRVDALARKIINHGRKDRYSHDILGYNYRMTNIAAAIGLAQITKISKMTDKRIAIAEKYSRALGDDHKYVLPSKHKKAKHVYHQYTLQCSDNAGLQEYLGAQGVETGIIYPLSIPAQPLYRKLGYRTDDVPVSRKMEGRVISIPVNPLLKDTEIKKVIAALESWEED